MQHTIPLILTPALLLTLLTGCENNDRQATGQPARQQEPVQIYSEDQQQTPTESEEPAQKIRTVTKFYNGQEYVAYDINPPLMHIPLAEIQKRAEADDPAAISELGRRYVHGQGVLQDLAKGFALGERAAQMGDVDALNDMGLAYKNGLYFEKDLEKAVEYFKRAAEQGDAIAQGNLGMAYAFGNGVEQDYEQAFQWSLKAAKQGLPVAQNTVGYLYNHGQGVQQDQTEATRWYRKAAEQGYAEAQYNLSLWWSLVSTIGISRWQGTP
jgi:TPR repeat protein